jgi:hypothetical protein
MGLSYNLQFATFCPKIKSEIGGNGHLREWCGFYRITL